MLSQNPSSSTPLFNSSLHSALGERPPKLPHRSSSTSSVGSVFSDVSVDVVTVEGLLHSETQLSAKKYKTPAFAETVLQIIHDIDVASWAGVTDSSLLKVIKVAGSLTNAVFFVSVPATMSTSTSSIHKAPRTLLLRIYGPSSGALISRPRELRTLHVLSSQYRIGPRVWGTFLNGRIEEFFESEALTHAALRDPSTSRWIGMRMAELHSVDMSTVEGSPHPLDAEGKTWDIAARKNVREWIMPAKEVLAMPCAPAHLAREFDLDGFLATWTRYSDWLGAFEKKMGKSPRVFSHNDAQYGNLLKITRPDSSAPEHRQIIVVDFEYASPNASAFDIANHFHEWTANYHGPHPYLLNVDDYPSEEQRFNYYAGYLHGVDPSATVSELDLHSLDVQVRAWSPASHAMWAIWGVVQAREMLEGATGESEGEFDYVAYARCRFQLFRDEITRLGL